jgi:hypothetical protein
MPSGVEMRPVASLVAYADGTDKTLTNTLAGPTIIECYRFSSVVNTVEGALPPMG